MTTYSRSILLDNIGGPALSDHQVRVKLRDQNFKDFSLLRSDGADIRITDESSNALPFWLENFDQTNKIADIHVKITLTADAVNTIILLYGDNSTPTLSSYSNTMSKLPNLDSSYLAAYQLDAGTGTSATDATGNGNTATLVNAPTWDGTDGGNYKNSSPVISFNTGSCITLNGTNQIITCGTVLDTVPNEGTIAFWFKWITIPSGSDKRIFTKCNQPSPNNAIDFYRSNSDSLYKLRVGNNDTNYFSSIDASYLDNTNWNYIEITWGPLGTEIKVNAVRLAGSIEFTTGWGNMSGGAPLTFGCLNEPGNVVQYINAKFDCITIQNRQRTNSESLSAYSRLKYIKHLVRDAVTRSASNPVLSPSTEYSSTCTGIYEPSVALSSDGNTVYMFYTAFRPSDSRSATYLAHTSSSNFPTGWTKDGALVGLGTGGESGDSCRNNLYIENGVWYMFYADSNPTLVSNLRLITSSNEGSTWSSPVTVISTSELPSGALGSTNTRIIKIGSTYHLFNELGYSSAPQWRLTRWTASAIDGPYTYQGVINSLQPGSGTSTFSSGGVFNVFGIQHIVYHGTPGADAGTLPSYLWHAYSEDITVDNWVKDGALNWIIKPLGTSPPEYDQCADAKFFEINHKAYIVYDGVDNNNPLSAWVNVLESNVTLNQLLDGYGAPYAFGPSNATGSLTGGGAALSGTASNFTPHSTDGALQSSGATLSGTAAHIAIHATSGDLAAGGATISGSALHAGLVEHATSGALVNSGASLSGTASHVTPVIHATIGALSGWGAEITGTAQNGTVAEEQHFSGGYFEKTKKPPKKRKKVYEIDPVTGNKIAYSVIEDNVVQGPGQIDIIVVNNVNQIDEQRYKILAAAALLASN